MSKKTLSMMLGMTTACIAAASTSISGNDVALKFNPENYTIKELVMPDGKTVRYCAYEHIYYVTNIEDSTYQYLNFYVPESIQCSQKEVPIFLRTYVGGYMAAQAKEPSGTDATGRALAEGYVVCIPGSRGHNSIIEKNNRKIFTGRAPQGLLDLKAAIGYLRYNDRVMPGDAELIITDGTSAGGAMSALLGATGNAPVYDIYLKSMGAADTKDDVFAAVCYCPITDLEHADMSYEWLYSCTNTGVRQLSEEQQEISKELAAAYSEYLNSLQLKHPNDNTPITANNYLDYVKSFIIQSAQKAKNEGCDIPSNIGIIMNGKSKPNFDPTGQREPNRPRPQGEYRQPKGKEGGKQTPFHGPQGAGSMHTQGEFVIDVDMAAYLNYVATTQPLKTPPAFDAMNVLDNRSTPENSEFGDENGSAVNFTEYTIEKVAGNKQIDKSLQNRIYMMNPMNFIGDGNSKQAQYWYIRHGARDRDTSFPIPVNLATKLINNGYDVNFALPWNRPHSGDYNLDDLFVWIKQILPSGEKK